MCEWSNPSCLTIRINGTSLGLTQDLDLITVYITPENSSYLKSTGINAFDLLLQAHNRISPMAHVIWMGDFNAHLDEETSSSPHVTPDLLPALNFDLASADPPAKGSLDRRKVDSYGKRLLQLCGDRGLIILNGCTPGDSQGYFTYYFTNFHVDHHNPIMSDYSLLRLELNRVGSKDIIHPPAVGHPPLLKFDWSPEAMEYLRLRFSSPPLPPPNPNPWG